MNPFYPLINFAERSKVSALFNYVEWWGVFASLLIYINRCKFLDFIQFKRFHRSEKMSTKKRLHEEAFNRKKLRSVEVDDYLVEHTIYKVKKRYDGHSFDIKTAQNSEYIYADNIIRETATSATLYVDEKKATKTELIKIFSSLSINDIWNATYLIQDKNENWQEELATKIQSMDKKDAVKYIKKDFATFGKVERRMVGQKISPNSDNNYYLVRDLNIHFDALEEGVNVAVAAKNSIRQLDVNTLQTLIFNSIKYVLK